MLDSLPLRLASIVLVAGLAALVIAAPAAAETVIEVYPGPLPEHVTSRMASSSPDALSAPSLFASRDELKGAAGGSQLLFPFFVDDRIDADSSTLFSIRHARDNDNPIQGTYTLYDENFDVVTEELFELAPNELLTRNLATDPDAVDPGGVSAGVLTIETNGPVTADYFQVDEAGDFATGDRALTDGDFCEDWQARFLRFGLDDAEGTELTFILNGPLGGDSETDPPTITGEVFDEAGNLINTFAVFTGRWLIRVPVLDSFVTDTGPDFGTLRMSIDTEFSGGVVFERHTAFGRFSVGTNAVCRDSGPIPL